MSWAMHERMWARRWRRLATAARAVLVVATLAGTGLAFTGHADALAVVYSGRNFNANSFFLAQTAAAAAGFAGNFGYFARAFAVRAGRGRSNGAENSPSLRADLPLTVAFGAGNGFTPAFRARPFAGRAFIPFLQSNFFFHSKNRFLKRNGYAHFQIYAFVLAGSPFAPPAEDIAEDIA